MQFPTPIKLRNESSSVDGKTGSRQDGIFISFGALVAAWFNLSSLIKTCFGSFHMGYCVEIKGFMLPPPPLKGRYFAQGLHALPDKDTLGLVREKCFPPIGRQPSARYKR